MAKQTDIEIADESLSRREFTLEAALALLSTVVITVEGCGSSNNAAPPAPSPPAPAPPAPAADINGTVSANHGHIAVITGAQITAGNAISLNIQGNATHSHTVDISQADLRTLQNRQAVAKDSSNTSGHMHTVTFTPM
jgi:hypothetical protein